MSNFHLFWTIALMIIFVGIIVWAWSGKRSSDFEEAAQLPLENGDDSEVIPVGVTRRKANDV
jgi:cytochrome c oxidase cbb3-type subunit 4